MPKSKADDLKGFFYEILNYIKYNGADKILKNYYDLNLNRLLEIELSESKLKKFSIILIELLNSINKLGIDKVSEMLKQGSRFDLTNGYIFRH